MMRILIGALCLVLLVLPLRAAEDDGSPTTLEEKKLMERVSPYIVKVLAEQKQQNKRYVVTGLVIAEGRVLTSALISRFGDERIVVINTEGRSFETDLVGLDSNSSLALLKLKGGQLPHFKALSQVETGDPVWVVGAYYDHFPSLYKGVVSNANKDQIVINSPAMPGVSGGAVVSSTGQLVGIVRGRLSVAWDRELRIRSDETELLLSGENPREQPLLLAVPIQNAKAIAAELIEYGHVRSGWVGLWCQQTDPTGFVITEITPDSPAALAGLKTGDLIDRLDSTPVKTLFDLRQVIMGKRPGEKLEVVVVREGQSKAIPVTVGENPQMPNREGYRSWVDSVSKVPSNWSVRQSPDAHYRIMRFNAPPQLGLSGTLISKELAEKHGIKEGYGILLNEVHSESPLSSLNLRSGDVVVEVDGIHIQSLDDLERAARALETIRLGQSQSVSAQLRYYRNSQARLQTINLQSQPLKMDEIQQLRNRVEQITDILRTKEFQALSDALQRIRDRADGEFSSSDLAEISQLERRIETYHKRSLERIEAEYIYLKEALNKLKRDLKQ